MASDLPRSGGIGGSGRSACRGGVWREQARGPAESDVNDREETGDEGGGVTERDDNDMGREPEIGIEHGAHHFHCVAAEGEVVGDQQCDETGNDATATPMPTR